MQVNTDNGQELYEPLWDELHQQSEKQGWRIRSIWIADMSNQGYSGVLNEDKLGSERKYRQSTDPIYTNLKTHTQPAGTTTHAICST